MILGQSLYYQSLRSVEIHIYYIYYAKYKALDVQGNALCLVSFFVSTFLQTTSKSRLLPTFLSHDLANNDYSRDTQTCRKKFKKVWICIRQSCTRIIILWNWPHSRRWWIITYNRAIWLRKKFRHKNKSSFKWKVTKYRMYST